MKIFHINIYFFFIELKIYLMNLYNKSYLFLLIVNYCSLKASSNSTKNLKQCNWLENSTSLKAGESYSKEFSECS